ncbi:hypothetical protein F5H01DRAFT_361520 [Linnemannia elongata]|nr:hypothetical protein F5H01DRAFT_361520 [Linnemannia elongata]
MADNPLTLFCLVNEEATSNAFPVAIESTMTIGDLKDLIKTKLSPQFDDIAAKDLTLWHVSIPVVPADKHKPIFLNETDSEELSPTDDVSDVFPKAPPKRMIHIIIQRPPQGNATRKCLQPL